MKLRLDELHVEWQDAEFNARRAQAEQYLAKGELTDSFREHCRAMHGLIKTFNQQRQREETFQPVWDKHDI
jgi:hypothetical protein